jgi:hypothetical protein
MLMFDKLAVTDVRRTADGYLVADARIARVGIQTYLGSEVGKPEMAQVRVYRSEEEVFHQDSLSSFAHRPITLDHPPVSVNARNWKKYAVGIASDEVVRDGGYVRIPMMVTDQAAMTANLSLPRASQKTGSHTTPSKPTSAEITLPSSMRAGLALTAVLATTNPTHWRLT